MRRLLFLTIASVLLFLLLPMTVNAQDEAAAYPVLFYSPTCPHCHIVMDDHLPPMQDEFGAGLQVIYVDVTQDYGSYLYQSACQALDTADRCGGVPMLVIGETMLFGSVEIPERLPGIVRRGLADGGIPPPDFPGMQEAFAAWQEVMTEEAAPSATSTAAPQSLTVWERLQADPEANALAVVVLLGLIASIGVVIWQRGRVEARLVRAVVFVIAAAGLLLAVSLVTTQNGDTWASLTAWGLLLAMLAAVLTLPFEEARESFGLPLVALAGVAVAVYLARVEMTEVEAVCGAVGNCNAVQQSPYAQIFGVPVGVVGVVGYAAMLLTWGLLRFTKSSTLQGALFVMVLLGVAFSIYLTFLEPFVIGATCAWCLMSAVTMLLLLWITAPRGWAALADLRR